MTSVAIQVILKGWLVMFILDVHLGTVSAQFECREENGLVSTPNIPDSYFNPSTAEQLKTKKPVPTLTTTILGTTYVFTIPSEGSQRNCSGRVMGLKYCFEARINEINNNFAKQIYFLRLTKTQGNFRVDEKLLLETTLMAGMCSDGGSTRICCEHYQLDATNQVVIPPIPFTFGIVVENLQLLAFSHFEMDFNFPQYQLSLGNGKPDLDDMFAAGPLVTDRSLLMFKFIIESEEISTTQAPETTLPTTAETALLTTATETTQLPIGTETTDVSDTENTTPPNDDAITSSPTTQSPDFSKSTTPLMSTTEVMENSPTTSIEVGKQASFSPNSSSTSSAVGGAIGGVVVSLVLVGLVVLAAFMVIKKYRKTKKSDKSANNALHEEGDTLRPLCDSSAPVYAGIGPEVTDSKPSQKEPSLQLKNDYAECGASYEIPIASFEGINNQMYDEASFDNQVKGNKDFSGIANITYEESGYEDIYVVPATEESVLYAQLQDIMIPDLTRDAIKLGAKLGSGQFGVVYKGVLECGEGDGGKVEVAVKTLKEGSGEEDRVKFLQEAAIMGQFKHHNVVTMYGVVTTGEPTLLVLELLKQDLRKHLGSMRSDTEVNVDDHTLLSYCRQVASGMAYLSNKAFVHRDLAARNILVSDEDICKIADFGMSRDLADESYYVSHGGKIPVKWTAPEALHFKKYSTASDVWSYGALMYEIWSVGHKPYENYENNKVIRLLESRYRLPPPPGCPRALYHIMIQCWHPSPSQRPKFQDLSRKLSLPDPKLLKWSEEDKAVHPEAAKLGADLLSAQELFKDLQTVYKT